MARPLLDDRVKSLVKAGLFRPFDALILFLVVGGLMTTAAWAVFGQPSVLGILTALMGVTCLTLLWLVFLIYRCMTMVLDTQGIINLMPESAARLVLAFGRGQTAIPNTTPR